MKVTFLGVGSALAKKFFNTCALIELNGTNLLIDCGVTAPQSIRACGMEIDQIKNIAITHIHSDHVGGLEEIAFYNRYISKTKPTLFVPSTLQDMLWDNCLKGGLRQTNEGFMELQDYFTSGIVKAALVRHGCPVPKEVMMQNWFTVANQKFKFIRTHHIEHKKSYGVWCPGKFLYTSDTRFDPDMLEIYGKDVKYIFHDCQLHKGGDAHTTLDELMTVAEPYKSKIVLMHYGDESIYYQREMSQFIIAHQGMSFEI